MPLSSPAWQTRSCMPYQKGCDLLLLDACLQAVGSIGSAWFGGWLVQLLGPRPVLLMSAVFPAGVTCTAFMIREQRVDPLHTGGQHAGERFDIS